MKQPTERTSQSVTSEQAIHGPGCKAGPDLQWRALKKCYFHIFSTPDSRIETGRMDGIGRGHSRVGGEERSSRVPSLFTVLPRAAAARRRVRKTRDNGRANAVAAMEADQQVDGLMAEERAAGNHKASGRSGAAPVPE